MKQTTLLRWGFIIGFLISLPLVVSAEENATAPSSLAKEVKGQNPDRLRKLSCISHLAVSAPLQPGGGWEEGLAGQTSLSRFCPCLHQIIPA